MKHAFSGCVALTCAFVLILSGCASTPEPRYYELRATARRDAVIRPLSILVNPITIPPDVDRPQFVLASSSNEVAIDDLHRWAAPLQDEIALAVRQNLAALAGSDDVRLAGEPGGAATYIVDITVRDFESRLADAAEIDASWRVRRDDGVVRSGHSTTRVPVRAPGFDALANAHGTALEQLCEAIAQAILAMDTGR